MERPGRDEGILVRTTIIIRLFDGAGGRNELNDGVQVAGLSIESDSH